MEVPLQLIDRLKRKDHKAFAEFMDAFGGRILNFGFRMCGDREDAKEVLQDTLMKTFESIDTLKKPEAFSGWLYRIAQNACLLRRRRSKFVKKELSLEESKPDPASLALPWSRLPDEAVLGGELREKLEAAILDLPETYRSVLVMRDLEDLDTGTTAEALGLSRDVVKMRLHRARAKVRNLLADYLRGQREEGKGIRQDPA